jgi:sulfate permease, SulP family
MVQNGRRAVHKRYHLAKSYLSRNLRPGIALREALRPGYTRRDLAADLLAGMIVGTIALPLGMALAIASGVAPQHGIYTAIVAGGLVAILGGSRMQVSGPTAAFVVILAPIATRFGLGGLCLAGLMAGALLIVMGLARMGRLIEFIPHPVTTGFTSGIAVVIATFQVKDLLGLTVSAGADHYLGRVADLVRALPSARAPDMIVGFGTLAVLLIWPRVSRRLPAPLVALALATASAWALCRLVPGFHVATVGSRFGGIPAGFPMPVLPWALGGRNGAALVVDFELFRSLLPSAFAIAVLGAIESLLCAVVADGMAGTRHDPDAELVAQGVGNVVAPFFGGIACTGAIARTATNIKNGARTPIATVVHGAFVLLGVVLLAPVLGMLPMAALAGLLMMVAWNMSEAKHFGHILRVAPGSDALVLLTCFGLTVLFDMVVAVSVGVVLAALLFMRGMADISKTHLVSEHPHSRQPLPPGVVWYEIDGPLFFGAAQKAMSALEQISGRNKVVILHLDDVPVIDVTGLVALESMLTRLHGMHAFVILADVLAQPAELLARAGIKEEEGKLAIRSTVEEALDLARAIAAGRSLGPSATMTVPPSGA